MERVTGFRSDIHLLRALAILCVFAYHLNTEHDALAIFGAGYLGVDIFFVISGYLITRILILQIEQNGELNFVEFYQRRVRRIVPATLVVLLIVNLVTPFFGVRS